MDQPDPIDVGRVVDLHHSPHGAEGVVYGFATDEETGERMVKVRTPTTTLFLSSAYVARNLRTKRTSE